ncbi:hypothetical protein BC938DRAFT_473509 [Jimgerdemannia flammicorona]|uniref:Uncharacterized protein n=1 Tax=Jimgerdemannia flammicorona TaxID=994334 RepID=A0A433Q4A3_9FUNG|nr:hypothetical protein BC938DRAFT_473509 [Jimgerdemannia flammicorona]
MARKPAVGNVTQLPSFQNHVYNDYKVEDNFPCSTFTDGSVTFVANTYLPGVSEGEHPDSERHTTIRTVYTNGTKCTVRLSKDYEYEILSSGRLSNGNILLVYRIRLITEIFAMILEPCGGVLQKQIRLNMTTTYVARACPHCMVSSSTFGGFLCRGLSLDKLRPVWARFDNTGSMLGDGPESSEVFDHYPVLNITNDQEYATITWEGYSVPTATGGFLLVWSYINMTIPNTPGNISTLFKVVYAATTEPNTAMLNSQPFVIYQSYEYQYDFWGFVGIE